MTIDRDTLVLCFQSPLVLEHAGATMEDSTEMSHYYQA